MRLQKEVFMKSTVIELNADMEDVLEALERNEEVPVFYRGQLKGVILPIRTKKKFISKDHPSFGMWADDSRSVEEIMEELRKPRYGDL